MFHYISSLFGSKESTPKSSLLEENKQNKQNYNSINELHNGKKYNCKYCFNSFNDIDEQTDHEISCQMKPKQKSNILCNRCGRNSHLEDKCYEIKHIQGYYLRKFNN